MRKLMGPIAILLGALVASSTAYGQATLVKTLDLSAWTGAPVVQSAFPLPSPIVITNPFYVQVPQPAPGSAFSLTGIAVDPVLNRVYVADHASSNVYLIDGATNTVSSAVYTYGFFGNVDVKQPPVVATTDPLLAHKPEFERCAAMRAMQFEEPDGAALVAEHHQFFAEDLDPLRQVFQFVGKADRVPEAAHVFAARRLRADMGELLILLRYAAMQVSAVSGFQERRSSGHKKPPADDNRKLL